MKKMSCISVIALAPAVFLFSSANSSANHRVVLPFIVCWTASVLLMQTFRASQYAAQFCKK